MESHVKEWLRDTTASSIQWDSQGAKCDDGVATRLCTLSIGVLLSFRSSLFEFEPSYKGEELFQETLTRLQLWRDGFGPGELEEVLDQSQRFRQAVFGHLVAIGEALRKWRSFQKSSMGKDDIGTQLKEIAALVEELKTLLGTGENHSDDDASGTDCSPDSPDGLPSFSERILEEIDHHARLLMKLLPSLQHFIEFRRREGDKTASKENHFTASHAASAYIDIVREKFPEAKSDLVERLGEANWERHLRIRERLEDLKQNAEARQAFVAAKSVFRPISMFQDSALGSSIRKPSDYAASAVSHSSFRTNATEGGKGSLRVPETPREVELGIPFPCAICGDTLDDITNRYQWKIHVFSDLEAYICTFTDCQYSLATFPNRELWAAHEFSVHRTAKVWTCAECGIDFMTEDDCRIHYENQQHVTYLGADVQVAVLASERLRERECPLCFKVTNGKYRDFVSHVGKHMEAIALSSMPKDSMESDSESDKEQSLISDEEIGDPNGTSSTINQEEDMAIISNTNEGSLPQINVHDSSEMDTSKWNPDFLVFSPGSSIKTARELMPPPLPPPRHLVDIADGGHDRPENAWKWGDSEMYSGDLAKPTLSIPPGSNLYGESATPGARSVGEHSNGTAGTDEKDPFLSLLEQLAENENNMRGPSELDFFLSGATE